MAVTKIRRLSSWTLWAVTLISVIVLGFFYLGGVVDPNAEQKAPVHTDLLLYWCYIIFAITIVVLVILGLFQFVSTVKTKPKSALASLGVLILFAALLGLTYSMGNGTALAGINEDSAQFNTPFWLKVSDMWIYSMFILLVICILALVSGTVIKVLRK
jgi:magnesium-transporting ATPase (P-type)